MKPVIRLAYLAAFSLCLFVAYGCSDLNGTRLEPVLGGEINLVALGDTVAETLINQVMPPLYSHHGNQPILVTTVVNNDALDDSASFGRSLQNNIAAGFVSRGYAVREIKLRKQMRVEENKGELMLSRNLQELAGKQHAQAIVVGTYTMANRVMYLSIRLVNPVDQAIRAVYEDKLYLDENSLRMLGLQFTSASEEILPPKPSVLDCILY